MTNKSIVGLGCFRPDGGDGEGAIYKAPVVVTEVKCNGETVTKTMFRGAAIHSADLHQLAAAQSEYKLAIDALLTRVTEGTITRVDLEHALGEALSTADMICDAIRTLAGLR